MKYNSPWVPILAPHADALPRAFREQFLLPADADGPYHIYGRRFQFRQSYTFKTLTQYDTKRARPIERSGRA